MCQERKGPGHESDLEPAEELLSLLLLLLLRLLPVLLLFCSRGDCAFVRLPIPLDPPNYRGTREGRDGNGGENVPSLLLEYEMDFCSSLAPLITPGRNAHVSVTSRDDFRLEFGQAFRLDMTSQLLQMTNSTFRFFSSFTLLSFIRLIFFYLSQSSSFSLLENKARNTSLACRKVFLLSMCTREMRIVSRRVVVHYNLSSIAGIATYTSCPAQHTRRHYLLVPVCREPRLLEFPCAFHCLTTKRGGNKGGGSYSFLLRVGARRVDVST